jgi:hypothetical protein
VATKEDNLTSSPKSPKQEAFERDAREKLENADMDAFDRMMKRLIDVPKAKVDGPISQPKKRG